MTAIATLSAKFQISIPNKVRDEQRWKAGQEFVFIPEGKGVLVMTVPERSELAGIAKGARNTDYSIATIGLMAAGELRVIDTSAWIEWLTQSPVGRKLERQIPDQPRCIVPTIVQLELSKWLVREIGEDEADRMIAYTHRSVGSYRSTRRSRCADLLPVWHLRWLREDVRRARRSGGVMQGDGTPLNSCHPGATTRQSGSLRYHEPPRPPEAHGPPEPRPEGPPPPMTTSAPASPPAASSEDTFAAPASR